MTAPSDLFSVHITISVNIVAYMKTDENTDGLRDLFHNVCI